MKLNADGTQAAKAGSAAGLLGTNLLLKPSPLALQAVYKINGEDIRAVYLAVAARLVTDDPAKPDQRAQAKYYVGVGVEANFKNGKSTWIGASRFKKVAQTYQTFNFLSLNVADAQFAGLPETVGVDLVCTIYSTQVHRR